MCDLVSHSYASNIEKLQWDCYVEKNNTDSEGSSHFNCIFSLASCSESSKLYFSAYERIHFFLYGKCILYQSYWWKFSVPLAGKLSLS